MTGEWRPWVNWGTMRRSLGLVDAVGNSYGAELADKFAFANAYDFLWAELPCD